LALKDVRVELVENPQMSVSAPRDNVLELNLLLEDGAKRLTAAGSDSARLDSELLLAHACYASREALLTRSVIFDEAIRDRYAALINLRVSRMPIAYILGRRELYSLEFKVSPDVLIPRPETEIVIAAALEILWSRPAAKILDLGTGSGAIGLAIAANATHVKVVATDISAKALEVAVTNSKLLGLAARVEFRLADCWQARDGGGPLGSFDLVVSNPPYIRDAEIASLAPEISNYEPRLALAGGPDGLNFYRRIAAGAGKHLTTGGTVIVEVGEGQAVAVADIFLASAFDDISTVNDLAGIQRVVIARKASAG
jgi:release factor glutamine methyltransferase